MGVFVFDMTTPTSSLAMNTLEELQLEVRIKRYDGCYRWCLLVASPYYNLDSKYAGYIGSIYDIHEKKEFEENLYRYRQIIHNATDIIFFLDLQGKILEVIKRRSIPMVIQRKSYTYWM
jgi:PAS domain-containing protein